MKGVKLHLSAQPNGNKTEKRAGLESGVWSNSRFPLNVRNKENFKNILLFVTTLLIFSSGVLVIQAFLFDVAGSIPPEMLTLNLERSDLLQLDPISSRGTLKLLPLGKKNKVRPIALRECRKQQQSTDFSISCSKNSLSVMTLGS